MLLGRFQAEELADWAVEAVEALVDFEHLIAADRLARVDARLVLGPFRAALAAVEDEASVMGPKHVGRGVRESSPAVAARCLRLRLPSLHGRVLRLL